MNLQSLIRDDLWTSIESTYETGNYTHAISAGIIHLSNKLREKGDVDGDGVELVTKTLSLKNPKIKLNKLQTKTDKVVQEGFYFIVRGIYQAIRDPRSHESHLELQDSKEIADSILLFLNFILENIDSAKGSFVLEDLKNRVFDKNFLNNNRYAELLVDEIPQIKKFDTLIEIHRDKLRGDVYSVSLFLRTLFFELSEDEQNDFLSIVSDELCVTNNNAELKYNLQIIPINYWNKLSELAKLRIEGILIKSLEEGELTHDDKLQGGGLATFGRQHIKDFSLVNQVRVVITNKIKSENYQEQMYIMKFFLCVISDFIDDDWRMKQIIDPIASRISNGFSAFEDELINNFSSLSEKWMKKFQEAFVNELPGFHQMVFLPDGSTLFPSEENDNDEIPF